MDNTVHIRKRDSQGKIFLKYLIHQFPFWEYCSIFASENIINGANFCKKYYQAVLGKIVARINYEKQWIFIRFIGTHDDYEKIDANKI
ncbi:MAG: type II toxin-antitoxin system HigB family toxin [Bacteroidales bacterium]|nr:type II toxin-antitoxin system HigB family toxin [Bacteroidales bacterium]